MEVQATDERGKLDVNQADEETLVNLLTGHGMEEAYAELLAAAVNGEQHSNHPLARSILETGKQARIEFGRPVTDPVLHILNLQGTVRFSAAEISATVNSGRFEPGGDPLMLLVPTIMNRWPV